MTWGRAVLIGLDQFANAILGGWPDETLSARAWRSRGRKGWGVACRVINTLFFWDKGPAGESHCEASWMAEINRTQAPPGERS